METGLPLVEVLTRIREDTEDQLHLMEAGTVRLWCGDSDCSSDQIALLRSLLVDVDTALGLANGGMPSGKKQIR